MACVPKKGSPLRKWFTNLAKELDVSENWLEPQIHSYWRQHGDGIVPSVADMRAFIQGDKVAGSADQIKLWERQYSRPIEYNTFEEISGAVAEASKYFDESAISTRQSSNGKWVMSVEAPVDADFNQTMNTLYDLKDFIKGIKDLVWHSHGGSWKETEELTNVVHQWNGRLWLPKRPSLDGSLFTVSKQLFDKLVSNYGLQDAVSLVENANSIEVVVNEQKLKDYIEESKQVMDAYDNSEEANKVLDILNFLKGRLGVDYHFITEKEAGRIVSKLKPNQNAFYYNGHAYFIKGRKLTADIAAEEMLHPLIGAIQHSNTELFNDLVSDAQKLYPKLHLQIKKAYSADRVEEELVTQALSRAFKQERSNTPITRKAKALINKFTTWFVNLFSKDNASLLQFGKNDVITLDKMAQFINSDMELNYTPSKSFKFNQGSADLTISGVQSPKVVVETHKGYWSREEVAANPDKVYLFGDNTEDRTVLHYRPTQTQAVIRGLDNAIGIDTKKNRGTSKGSYFTDADFESFKAQVDEAIQMAVNSDKTIVLPEDGIGTGKAMLADKAPKCNAYLQEQLSLLKDGKILPISETNASVDEKAQVNFEAHTTTISDQLTALDNNTVGLTSTEISEIGEECVYWISDLITDYLADPEVLFNTPKFSHLKTMLNESWDKETDIAKVKGMSRQQLVNFLGAQNIMDLCRETLFENNPILSDANTSLDLIEQADLLSSCFNAIMQKASATFTSVEKFSIKYNPERNNLEVSEEMNPDEDNFNEDSNDVDTMREEGKTPEPWQVKNTQDVLTSMSQLVRSELTKCYDIEGFNTDGSPKYKLSKFGVRKRVNAKDATQQILRWTQGSVTYSDMVGKIEAKMNKKDGVATENMWLTQLMDKLTITPGQENPNTQFQSQFFGVFNKPFQLYSVVVKDGKGYRNVPVNNRPALRDAINSVKAQYRTGESPIFSISTGVRQNGLDRLKEASATLNELVKNGNSYRSVAELGENIDAVINSLTGAANVLGYYVTPEMVEAAINQEGAIEKMSRALSYMVSSLSKHVNNSAYDPFKVEKGGDGIYGNLRTFLTPLTEILEDTAVSSFYDSGNMHQSYITPSYLTKLMNKFHMEDAKAFDDFIMEEYGTSEWFHIGSNIERGWRNEWLRQMASMTPEQRKEIFQHKVEVSFNKHNYMRTMSDTEYAVSILTEYFVGSGKSDVAYYRIPIMSNKPSAEYISFYKYTDAKYKDSLAEGFMKIFSQELDRIITCNMREEAGINKKDPRFIKNFDSNGKKFMFLDFLNTHVSEQTPLGKLISDKISGKEIDETNLRTLFKEAVMETMDNRATAIIESWKSQGIVEALKQSEIAGKEDAEVEAAVREFIWNDTFAAMNILQLTITDTALYKDAEDLQKRLAQIHAPGIRANVEATDFNGNKVSDGYSRTIYLTDFEDVVSNAVSNVKVVFDRKIDSAATPAEKALYESLRDEVVSAFHSINLADAQALCSPTALRKKMFMFGKWGREQEAMYEKLRSGKYTYNDLKNVFSQPLKPFVYSQVNQTSFVGEAPMKTLKVGLQNKNSEYLILMADALMQNENTGMPNLLRAIFEVMEESHYDANGNYRTDGIDTVQFESAVKAGLSGKIDLRPFSGLYADMQKFNSPLEAERAAKTLLKNSLYDATGNYRDEYLHKFPYEDYCIQQEVPEHFRNHEQAHGSQTRYIIPSDLESVNSRGEVVTYNFYDPAVGAEKKLSADEFKKEYEETIAANIQESIEQLQQELFLDYEHLGDKKARNIALSKVLQREILSSPRYGVDLLQACSVDPVTGDFRIPLGDPIQSKRVEQLINSVIKNRVNKQTIAGGPVVQVSNFGTSRRLSIRYYSDEVDANGKRQLLKSRSEFEGTDAAYEKYCKEHQRGVAHWEIFAPIPSEDFYRKFADENGNIDVNAIEALDPDLLKVIGYRIPTEDKYSIIPMKIVGFLPREAGEGIMMPADVTLTTGSDFDVDKMYLMIKSLTITGNKKDGLNVVHPTEGREYRNNKILDMSYAVLTEETTADKELNPGGFEPQKRMGYMVQALRQNPSLSWAELSKKSVSELKDLCYTSKNLAYIDTHVQFYKQNNAAGSILGMFAVQKVAHAALEGNGYRVDVASACKLPISYRLNPDGTLALDRNGNPIPDGQYFKVAGFTFGDEMVIDAPFDSSGVQRIGKVLGNLVGMSADAVKDPVPNLMNINSQTASVLTTAIRLGMPFDDAALFLSQKVIGDMLKEYDSRNITSFTRLSDILQEKIDSISEEYGFEESSINDEELTKEELIQGIYSDDPRIQYKTLKAYQRISTIAKEIRSLTLSTRFNSVAAAVGPLVIDNLIMEHKIDKFSKYILDKNGNEVENIDHVFDAHPILRKFSDTFDIARSLFEDMPANSHGFRDILSHIGNISTSMVDTIYNDRKLLSTLSDFYQSYVLLSSGAVEEMADAAGISKSQRGRDYYITQFVSDFLKVKNSGQYDNNLLMQSIKLDTIKDSGRAILKVDTTGMDASQKEKLGAAWADLHKVNPRLSVHLFLYNFYRGGIGFNPKTFMNLVPTSLKTSKEFASYVRTYRSLPDTVSAIVFDQFVRNNASNSKLAPSIREARPNWSKFNSNGILSFSGKDLESVKDNPYIKIRYKGQDVLMKLQSIDFEGTDQESRSYVRIDALGNNGEYLEISNDPIDKSSERAAIKEGDESSNNTDMQEVPPTSDAESESPVEVNDKQLESLLLRIYQTPTNNTPEAAKAALARFKAKSDQDKAGYKKSVTAWMKNRMAQLNIQFDEALVEQLFKKMC